MSTKLCTFGEDVSLSVRLHAMPRQLPLIHDLQKLEFGKKLLGSVHTELHSKIAKSYHNVEWKPTFFNCFAFIDVDELGLLKFSFQIDVRMIKF